MKIQNFSQFINESALTVSMVESGMTGILNEDDRAHGEKIGLDIDALFKTAAVNITQMIDDLANKIDDPNFNPTTMPAAVDQFEKAVYALVEQETTKIMKDMKLGYRVVLKGFKIIFRPLFLNNNAADKPYGPISNIVSTVINIMMTNLKPDYKTAINTQKQLPVPPFTLSMMNGTKKTYGLFKSHATEKGQPFFKDGSKKDGCYNIDYWNALSDLLADRTPRITQKLVTIISTKVFG